jgi:hypothetical protein
MFKAEAALFVKKNGGFLPKAATLDSVAAARESAADFRTRRSSLGTERK